MELNFNSVEMSSKPSAEVSSLDYAEAPLTFNSVETIPVLNASAASSRLTAFLYFSNFCRISNTIIRK